MLDRKRTRLEAASTLTRNQMAIEVQPSHKATARRAIAATSDPPTRHVVALA